MDESKKCSKCGHALSRHYKKWGDTNITCSVSTCKCIIEEK